MSGTFTMIAIALTAIGTGVKQVNKTNKEMYTDIYRYAVALGSITFVIAACFSLFGV